MFLGCNCLLIRVASLSVGVDVVWRLDSGVVAAVIVLIDQRTWIHFIVVRV